MHPIKTRPGHLVELMLHNWEKYVDLFKKGDHPNIPIIEGMTQKQSDEEFMMFAFAEISLEIFYERTKDTIGSREKFNDYLLTGAMTELFKQALAVKQAKESLKH